MPATPLLNRIRNVIEHPEAFTRMEINAVLTDAGEAITMLKRIVARKVRENPSQPGYDEP